MHPAIGCTLSVLSCFQRFEERSLQPVEMFGETLSTAGYDERSCLMDRDMVIWTIFLSSDYGCVGGIDFSNLDSFFMKVW